MFAYGQQPKIKFRIQGEIKGLNNDSVILFAANYDENGVRIKRDTFITTAINDHFFIEGSTAGTPNVWALLGGYRSSKSFSFFIEKGIIKIKGVVDSLDNISITGTPGNNDQTQSRKVTNNIYSRIKHLRSQLESIQKHTDEYNLVTTAINLKFDSIQNYELNFIRTHPNSMVSGTYLYVKQDKLPIEKLEILYNSLGEEVKKSGFGLIVREKIKVRKWVSIGNMAPDFTSTDTSGNSVKFSDFRGKYVLLEFWANWCVPCRAQSSHLVEMYKRYKDKGFTILQYSIDEKSAERKWKDAIIKDQLAWTHISDLTGFENKVTKLYGVQPIPDNFLIDPNGRIVGRRLEGKELESKLEELIR